MNAKTTLIVLVVIAAILGLITFFVVFYGGSGSYVVTSNGNTASSSNVIVLTTTTPATSTASTSFSEAPSFASDFQSSVITWNEGRETMGITGASIAGNKLTFKLQIAMGAAQECVPLNMSMVRDESGALVAPDTLQFAFPESGSCEGAPGATYNAQEVIFTINPMALPIFFTTGGTSNVYFQVSTTTNGGLDVSVPSTSG